jgi:uncharacterized protein YjdB
MFTANLLQLRKCTAVVLAGFLAGSIAAPRASSASFAQTPQSPEATQGKSDITPEDQKDILAYILTMEKIRKMNAATKALKEWQTKNPKAAEASGADDQGGSLSAKAKSTDEKFPEVAAIIKKNGMDTKEYLISLYVFITATGFVSMKKSGQIKDYSAASGTINSANLEFVDAHWDEIQKMAPPTTDKE